jgi:hypothetical protein
MSRCRAAPKSHVQVHGWLAGWLPVVGTPAIVLADAVYVVV